MKTLFYSKKILIVLLLLSAPLFSVNFKNSQIYSIEADPINIEANFPSPTTNFFKLGDHSFDSNELWTCDNSITPFDSFFNSCGCTPQEDKKLLPYVTEIGSQRKIGSFSGFFEAFGTTYGFIGGSNGGSGGGGGGGKGNGSGGGGDFSGGGGGSGAGIGFLSSSGLPGTDDGETNGGNTGGSGSGEVTVLTPTNHVTSPEPSTWLTLGSMLLFFLVFFSFRKKPIMPK